MTFFCVKSNINVPPDNVQKENHVSVKKNGEGQ